MVLRPVHDNIIKVKTTKRIRKSTQTTGNNYVFPMALERKLENATVGLRPFFLKALHNISNGNALTLRSVRRQKTRLGKEEDEDKIGERRLLGSRVTFDGLFLEG